MRWVGYIELVEKVRNAYERLAKKKKSKEKTT
jgi:hypothetical protein